MTYKKNDYWDCKDLEDIINVVNGRPELVEEITNAEQGVKDYISQYIKKLLEDPKWLDAIKAIARQDRSRKIVLTALEKLSLLAINQK